MTTRVSEAESLSKPNPRTLNALGIMVEVFIYKPVDGIAAIFEIGYTLYRFIIDPQLRQDLRDEKKLLQQQPAPLTGNAAQEAFEKAIKDR